MNYNRFDENLKIEELKKDIERLSQKYRALKQEARNTRDPDAKIDLEAKAEKIYDELEVKKYDLKEFEMNNQQNISGNDNQSYLKAQEKLLNFDYQATLERFEQIIVKKFGEIGGAGVFVLEKRLPNGGRYCYDKLIDCLSKKTDPGKFLTKPITPLHGPQTQQGFLQRLAEQLQVNINSESLQKDIIQQIHSLFSRDDSGFICLFHVYNYDIFLKEEKNWTWFIEDFWSVLIQDLPHHPYLKLVFLLELDITIPTNISCHYSCKSVRDFQQKKIVKLPLKKCKESEIKKWLYNYSGFSRSFSDEIFETIKEATNGGKPDLVYDKFLEYLTQSIL